MHAALVETNRSQGRGGGIPQKKTRPLASRKDPLGRRTVPATGISARDVTAHSSAFVAVSLAVPPAGRHPSGLVIVLEQGGDLSRIRPRQPLAHVLVSLQPQLILRKATYWHRLSLLA